MVQQKYQRTEPIRGNIDDTSDPLERPDPRGRKRFMIPYKRKEDTLHLTPVI